MELTKTNVGGPILGLRQDAKRTPFAPLVTALMGIAKAVSSEDVSNPERFVLLPHDRYIQVLAYKTGKIVANFVPALDKDVKIESVCLATYPCKSQNMLDVLNKLKGDTDSSPHTAKQKETNYPDHVVLCGCSDGKLMEFPLLTLLPTFVELQKEFHTSNNCGSFELDSPCYGPRRIFKVSPDKRLSHMTVPSCPNHTGDGILIYALLARSDSSLIRVFLPPYYEDSMTEGTGIFDLCRKGSSSSSIAAIDEKICYNVGDDESDDSQDMAPFYLGSVVRDRSLNTTAASGQDYFLQRNVFVVVALPTRFLIYCELLSNASDNLEEKLLRPLSFNGLKNNKITSMAISVNKNDVACGFASGEIIVKSNILALVEDYYNALEKAEGESVTNNKKPEHPEEKVIDATVHWHSHPVSALSYDWNSSPADPILYSGGEESVLVTWQLSRGIRRPADVLPRLARKGIAHVVCPQRAEGKYRSNDSILVFCHDNSLHLLETHNKVKQWRVRGFPAMKGICMREEDLSPSLVTDPRRQVSDSSHIISNLLPDAPGDLQWYDPKEQRVAGTLEVSSYNRISSMQQKEDTPMPSPSVTHFLLSKSGTDLMTIDKASTENKFVGATETVGSNSRGKFGFVTIVKFWAWNAARLGMKEDGSDKPYELLAAMTHPHGPGNRVSSIGLSQKGDIACTVSNDEKAFRLWKKVTHTSVESEEKDISGRRTPVWVCQYKVTTPAGYSNHPTRKNALAFSSDSSILAICYGHMLTLWDCQNMTLLTCLNHLENDDTITSTTFVENDLIMCVSDQGVSLQSPFESQHGVGWAWSLRDDDRKSKVVCAQLLASSNAVVACVYDGTCDKSIFLLFDLQKGKLLRGSEGSVLCTSVSGLVCSIGQSESGKEVSNWSDVDNVSDSDQSSSLAFYALTSEGQLIEVRQDAKKSKVAAKSYPAIDTQQNYVPRLFTSASLSSDSERPRKRRRAAPTTSNPASQEQNGNISMARFGSLVEGTGNAVRLQTKELPSLSGNFARSFVGRNLLRRESLPNNSTC